MPPRILKTRWLLGCSAFLIGCSLALASQAVAQSGGASTAKQQATAIRAAVESVADSVVQIRTIGGLDAVNGTLLANGPTTGLLVSPDGYIVSSAFNFVQQPSSILITLANGKQVPAELVATDHSRMTVLLKARGVDDLPVPTMAPRSELRPGQWAIAVGRTFRADQVNVSVGIISALNRMYGRAVQTDTAVSTACYGGPLIDVRGRVVGILVPMAPQATSEVAGAEWYDSGIGFAVPLEPLDEWIKRMQTGENLRAGILGIGLAGKNPHSSKAKLATVRADSPAGRQGLKKDDLIVEVDGVPIKSQTDLRFALGPKYAGDTVRVVIQRGDERLEKTIELAGQLPVYRYAFLGILPTRAPGKDESVAENGDDALTDENEEKQPDQQNTTEQNQSPAGLRVRAVFPGSPAATSGIQSGDLITKIGETTIESFEDALTATANLVVGGSVPVQFQRDGETMNVELEPVRMPSTLAADSEAAVSQNTPITEKKEGETRSVKLPEFPNKCDIYVPSNETGGPRAMVVWLQPPGENDPGKVIAGWKSICDRDGILLVVPSPAAENKWELTEVEYLRRLTERILADYPIDSHRVVAFGQGAGGSMAWVLGFSSRDIFRGIATSAAQLPRKLKVPPSDPSFRMYVWAAMPASKDTASLIARDLEKVSEAGYPVSTEPAAEKSGKLSDKQQQELARWIDTLDRI